MNQRKRQPQIFFGINIFQAAHALQLALRQWRIAQTVMLTEGQRFAALKMLLFFQKRFNGIARLTAIWVDLVLGESNLVEVACIVVVMIKKK
jgi:hypothetical protein